MSTPVARSMKCTNSVLMVRERAVGQNNHAQAGTSQPSNASTTAASQLSATNEKNISGTGCCVTRGSEELLEAAPLFCVQSRFGTEHDPRYFTQKLRNVSWC